MRLGELIDGLGIGSGDGTQPADQEMVEAAVVLLKVVDESGEVSLRALWSDGLGWIERVGMLRAAERIELPPEGSRSWMD